MESSGGPKIWTSQENDLSRGSLKVAVLRSSRASEAANRCLGVGVLISSGSWSASIESHRESESSVRYVIPGTNYSGETALKRAKNSAAPSDFPIRVAQ